MTANVRFEERAPHEKGFAAYFDREIAPHLRRMEKERLQRRTRIITGAAIAVIVTAVIAGGLFLLFESLPVTFIAVVLIGTLGLFLAWRPAAAYKTMVRDVVMGPTCRFFGDLAYFAEAQDRFPYSRFRAIGVTPSANRVHLEDLFVGSHRDTAFQVVEAKLRQKGQKSSRTVFHGLLFVIDVPKTFTCRVLISRDHGFFNKIVGFFKGDMERVEVQDPDFEALFEVYADNRVEAKLLVSQGLQASLVALCDDHAAKTLTAAFADGALLLALPMNTKMFEVGSVWRSAYACQDDLRQLLTDIGMVHQVIDYLHGERPQAQAV